MSTNNLELKRELARLKKKNAALEQLAKDILDAEAPEVDFLKKILERAEIGVVIHDFKEVLYVNKAILEKFQITEEVLIGKNPFSFIDQKIKPEVLKRINKLRKGEYVETMEQIYTLPGGKVVEGLVSGFPITYEGRDAVLLILNDKTHEKKVEWENRKWLEIIEEIPASIFVTDKEHNIEYVNRFFCEFTGYSKEEVLGKQPRFLFAEIYEEHHFQTIAHTVRAGKIFTGQLMMKKKSGENYWADVRAKAIFNSENELQWHFNISIDVTDKVDTIAELVAIKEQLNQRVNEKTKELENKTKALERSSEALALMLEDLNEQRLELKRTNEELREANKSLDAFNSSISHDLKAPANRIVTLATMLKNRYGKDLQDQAAELLNDIMASATEMSQLIESMLLFARAGIEAPDVVEIDLKPLVQAVFEEEQEDFKQPDARLTVGTMHPFEGDYPLIKQVVHNLISNAFKYSKPEVPLHLTVYSEKDASGRYVTVYFQDNGIGFAGDEANKIFDFLYRSPNVKEIKGMGLGLSIVTKIINRHHGTLKAKAEPGKGAVISFTVPVRYGMDDGMEKTYSQI